MYVKSIVFVFGGPVFDEFHQINYTSVTLTREYIGSPYRGIYREYIIYEVIHENLQNRCFMVIFFNI